MLTSPLNRSAARPAFAPGRAWRGWTALLLAGISPLTACYTQVPVAGPATPGATVVLELNDRGRVALGDSIGPSAARVEGVVQSSSDSFYVMRVSAVRYLNGRSNQWSGEPLRVRADLVGRAQERRYSRGRTWALGLGVAGAVIALALTTDLFGSGSFSRDPGGDGGGHQQ